jgi:polar amino acid transport system substrate-binding protein
MLVLGACGSVPAEFAARRALAPTGTLRLGLISVPIHAIRDPYTGNLRGVSHNLGRELAARLNVPLKPIMYPNPTAYLEAGQTGEWDIGSQPVIPERMNFFDIAQPHLRVDYGWLVAAGTSIADVAEVDRPNVRVALVALSASESVLASNLKNASLVRGRDLSALVELLLLGEADVIGAQKTNLYNIAPRLPGSRVLEGSPGVEEQALAVPKGRDQAGLAFVRRFVEDAKRLRLVQVAIEQAGVRGVLPAP